MFIDVGPNLGAINRSALLASDALLLASDALLVPLAADLFSLQGLRNLGPTLRQWRDNWQRFVLPNAPAEVLTPRGRCAPSATWCSSTRSGWTARSRPTTDGYAGFPKEFHHSVLGKPNTAVKYENDPYQLASLRNYRSLMPLAQDARKPMFDLKAADGALGSTGRLVQTCYREFEQLAIRLMDAAGIAAASAMIIQ